MQLPDPFDKRVTCQACLYLVSERRCMNWRAAGLDQADVGGIKAIPQNCPGYQPMHTQTDTETAPQTDTTQTPTDTGAPEMIVSETTTASSYSPCPAGSYLARCTRLIDLGTHTTDFQGEAKQAHKVMLSFEVLDPDTRRDDGEPFLLSKRYTLSLHEKAALRKELASWRGRDFTPEELKGFDLRNILGKECFISVVETVKGDRTYSNIASIMKPPRGMPVPASTEPLLYWSMSDAQPAWEVFAQLHPKLAEQIQASPEYQRLTPPKTISTAATPAKPVQQQPAPAKKPEPPTVETERDFDDLDQDIPF